ncbi:MAG: citrate synthase family protein [Myxococcota bacterium]|nr:citrate synthase family protein [Myxococcota bacterium]
MGRETARIDNQYIRSEEACRRLGVKKATLYSYVSRGLVRCVRAGGRRRLYAVDDVDRLAAKSAARRGHAAVAVGALRWGDPVLDSAITSVEDGLRYRGRDVGALIADGVRYEAVAERLWEAEPGDWPTASPTSLEGPPVFRMTAALPGLALADPLRHGATAALEHARARRLVTALAAAASQVEVKGSIAEAVARGLAHERHAARVNAALVACADHELNVSTFAARVTASSGADLYACVGAALYAFSGPKHGAASLRLEAFVRECVSVGVERALRDRIARGDTVPGFHHPLYPDGDPRAAPLLALAREGDASPERDVAFALADAVPRATGAHPNLDLALYALARSMGGGPDLASALFGVGRTAGWIAHALEQRESPALLRPRARYTGTRYEGTE